MLAPVYDCGSSLYALADDYAMRAVLTRQDELDFRIYERPMSALCLDEKKIKYFDFIASPEHADCNAALQRIVPRIDIDMINNIIVGTPYFCGLHKEFSVSCCGRARSGSWILRSRGCRSRASCKLEQKRRRGG